MLIPQANIRSITDLREKIDLFINNVNKSDLPTIVLKGSKPQFAAVKITYLQKLLDKLEDYEDALLASELITESKNDSKKNYIPFEVIAKKYNLKLIK